MLTGKAYDAATQKALEDIDSCQNEIDTLNEKASEEILKVNPIFVNNKLIWTKNIFVYWFR